MMLVYSSTCLQGQNVLKLDIEIKTGDKRFAGTDDPVHLYIGGKDFDLDNPNHDDFERNQTDHFTFSINDPEYSVELIKAIGEIRIAKTEDSYFGGGWNFAGITIWINDMPDPIYTNHHVNRWLDGDHRNWGTSLGDEGWNLPEPPPFPPCKADDIIIFLTRPDKSNADKDSHLDSDCDGIPDDQDTTFDPKQPDDDGDGLPNRYETQNGLDPNNPDSDHDGWWDGKNIKDILLLSKVECIDEDGTVEIGSDETYVDVENVRFPDNESLDGSWEMDDNTQVEPFLPVDIRYRNGEDNNMVHYKSRIKLREADPAIAEKPTDDTFMSTLLDWGPEDSKAIDDPSGSHHYKLHFKSIKVSFMDPDPLKGHCDSEHDGITDSLEFLISTQNGLIRSGTAIDGYNGLSSPVRKDLFIEQDATSADDNMPFDAKQQITSQFYYHNIFLKLDDGYLGGGSLLPFKDNVDFNDLINIKSANMDQKRNHFYRYLLYVPNMASGENGRAKRPGTHFMVSRSTMVGSFSAIVCMHELGHTLSLCHPLEAKEHPIVSPTCPTPTNWNGLCSSPCNCNSLDTTGHSCCSHYCGVGDKDVTAMGADIGLESIVIGGLAGAFIALGIIALLIPGAGWIVGGLLVLGGLLVGAIGGFFFSDAYERIVNYHPNEWAVLFFKIF